mmetsp:Transcript_36262/g.99956  ORF Transcript_36262/g.99956 Transcript_36262/m.99956 type:complete len:402 (+) Transcript_36262:196-1401(+)|eukprot:CAMPEP_0117596044 /NCGR_PEP_ID=MMETSP0784-20121206/74089_1 /TAXON_ID=39447 /ORGANISM="" /LENGTH=401 /DNA_ID=CAMNT_0005398273 /DNA_START=145 /DNA_END=1350 /DNA_ORIENTATION=+
MAELAAAVAPASDPPKTSETTAVASDAAVGNGTGKRAAPSARTAGAPGDGQGDAKRRRADFTIGDSGVFFTTVSPSGSGNARRDLVRLLDDAFANRVKSRAAGEGQPKEAGARAGEEKGASDVPAGASTAGTRLDAELQELRATPQRFVPVSREEACPKGTGFVRFAGDVADCAPSELVELLLDRQKAEFKAHGVAPSSRQLCRVLPVDFSCKPFLDDFRRLAAAVLPKHVGPEAEPTVWALEFKARNTSSLKKDAVLGVIDEIVPKGRHRVNLSDPAKLILVEVNPLFCGLSVVARWAEFSKYNINALTTPPEQRKNGAAKRGALAPVVASPASSPAAVPPAAKDDGQQGAKAAVATAATAASAEPEAQAPEVSRVGTDADAATASAAPPAPVAEAAPAV